MKCINEVSEVALVQYIMVVASEAEGGHDIKYPVGKYLDHKEAREHLISGKMMQCVFKKKDGTITSRNVHGETTGSLKPPYIAVKDVQKVKAGLPPYINIREDNILAVVIDGAMHLVNRNEVPEVRSA